MHRAISPDKPSRDHPKLPLRNALIVEDCGSLHAPLVEVTSSYATRVEVFGTCESALQRLRCGPLPQLVLLDVCLPDGSALDIVSSLRQSPSFPAIVALSGSTDPATAFALAQQGIKVFVSKPLSVTQLHAAIRTSLSQAPDFTVHARNAVGLVPIHVMESQVRDAMLTEALAQSQGNRRAAAKLLSISRQLLQHMIRAKG
jgi:two-component system response regulator RegA